MKTLTPEQSTRLAMLQAQNKANRAAWAKYAQPTYATKEQSAQIDAEAPFSNEQRAELETLLFLSTPAQREFVYPSDDLRTLTGFMGNKLATITYLAPAFRSNFGDTRRAVRATGINGTHYVGTIYGTYCRLRPAKV